MVKINGNFLYLAKRYIQTQHGDEAYEKVISKLRDDSKDIFKSIITTGDFYEYTIYNDLLDVIKSEFGHEELRRYNEFLAEKQLSGIFGLFVNFLSVEKVLNQAEKIWAKSYEGGGIKVIESSDNQIKVKIFDFPTNENSRYSFQEYFRKLCEIVSKKKAVATTVDLDSTTHEFTIKY